MKLKEFIEKYIEPNSIIRLVYRNTGGHKIVLNSWNDVIMEWSILKSQGDGRHYIDNEVLGIASIMSNGHYTEAINIVIEELENQPYIDEVFEEQLFVETI
jgi:hypothetical protein